MMENEKIEVAGWNAGDSWHDIVKHLKKLLYALIWELYPVSDKPAALRELVKKSLYILCWLLYLARH